MKMRPSIPLLIVTTALPCAAALSAMDKFGGGVFALIAIACMAALLFFCVRPLPKNELYSDIIPLRNGVSLYVTYGFAVLFHTAAFILLKVFLKMTFLPSLSFVLWAHGIGCLILIFGGIRLLLQCRQLSLAQRMLLVVLFWIPFINLFVINSVSKTAYSEYDREASRIELDNARAESEICKTKYPILLVHGIFFRDSNFFNYWGRVPAELIKNGAMVYYGDQHSAAGVEDCAKELCDRIDELISFTGCEKVNVIAHSKGGLDIRCAANMPELRGKIASITTINTPHQGCRYADFLMQTLPHAFLDFIASKYNSTLARFGEEGADFIKGVTDLTAERCLEFNQKTPYPEGVFCQSYGSYMKKWSSAGFPLNFAYLVAALFSSSSNDGLVDIDSMKWGDSFTCIKPKSSRGISHGDVIDLFREDFSGFDVREMYVDIVSGLKNKGF